MLRIILLALGVLAIACALPQQPEAPAHAATGPVQIVKQDSEQDLNGYKFEYETSDGTSRVEQGDYRNDTEQQGLLVKGSYKYVAPDGQQIAVSYVADQNGYKTMDQDKPQDPTPGQS